LNLAFDHLVHFTNDPITAAEKLQQEGFLAFPGGEHPNWGTFNALSYFGLSYLEFLGINHRNTAETAALENDLINQAIQLLPNSEGFGRVALRTSDIESVASRMKGMGFKIQGPIPGHRTRADGITIQWKMLFTKTPGDEQLLPFPFFIQWHQSDEERKQDLDKYSKTHSISNLKLKEVVFAVHDSHKTASTWSEYFQLKLRPLEKEQEAYMLVLNGGNLVFKSTRSSMVVAERLKSHGEGPFLMNFVGDQIIPATEIAGSYFQVN
jgi:hypothetical protein